MITYSQSSHASATGAQNATGRDRADGLDRPRKVRYEPALFSEEKSKMRGFLQPAVHLTPSETQTTFATLSRHRRSKLAETANTTLVKADQWARGAAVPADVSEALERAVTSRKGAGKK